MFCAHLYAFLSEVRWTSWRFLVEKWSKISSFSFHQLMFSFVNLKKLDLWLMFKNARSFKRKPATRFPLTFRCFCIILSADSCTVIRLLWLTHFRYFAAEARRRPWEIKRLIVYPPSQSSASCTLTERSFIVSDRRGSRLSTRKSSGLEKLRHDVLVWRSARGGRKSEFTINSLYFISHPN